MEIKNKWISLYVFTLSFLTVFSDIGLSATKAKNIRKATSKASGSAKKSSSKSIRATSRGLTTVASTTLSTVETTNSSESDINDSNCDFKYTLCMNNICNDPKIGKCLCYEDKYTNKSNQQFININGNNLRKGFELFEYAKKQCLYILDKCMNVRRSVTEKYSNLIQRDCLMISETEVAKEQGLSGELNELKSCIVDYCTASNMGQEDFSMPEFGLCFDPIVARYQLDANCSYIIAKSKTPAGLRELFMNDMTKLREESCEKMNGEMSNDRQKCYINVSYGPNKDRISASKKIAVGDYFTCNGEEFNTNLGLTEEFQRKKKHAKLSLTAKSLRATGNVVGLVVGESAIGMAVEGTIDVATHAANVYANKKMIDEGYLSKKDGITQIVSELTLGISTAISTSKAYQNISKETDNYKKAALINKLKQEHNKANGIEGKDKKKDTGFKLEDYGITEDDYNELTYNEMVNKMQEFAVVNQVNLGILEIVKIGVDPNSFDIKELKKKQLQEKLDEKNLSETEKKAIEDKKAADAEKQAAAAKVSNISRGLAVAASAVDLAGGITDYAMQSKIDDITIENEKKGIIKHAEFENRDEGVGQVNSTATVRGNCFVNDEWFATENEIILLQWKL
ncbi:hypothetical protein HDR59_03835 [bacterium]|nr:hypothetical protein [bacterium]